MKKLSVAALTMGTIGILLGLYIMFEVAPYLEYLDGITNPSRVMRGEWMRTHNLKMNLGTGSMGLGFVGFIMALVAGIKSKETLAWVASALCLVTFFMGAAYATHMFS